LNVDVKVLTGDNEIITAYICKQVGMPVEHLLLGSQIETMSETELAEAATRPASLPGCPGSQGTHHPCAPEQGPRVGVHGRRHQRRPALKAADVASR